MGVTSCVAAKNRLNIGAGEEEEYLYNYINYITTIRRNVDILMYIHSSTSDVLTANRVHSILIRLIQNHSVYLTPTSPPPVKIPIVIHRWSLIQICLSLIVLFCAKQPNGNKLSA